MSSLDQLHFVFVTGKGGVGKTTVSAALAQRLAGKGRRVLVALCGAKERLSTLFGVAPIGTEIRSIAPNISAVRLTADVALRQYGGMVLRSQAVYNAVFDNKYVKSFFSAVPGLSEWAVLGKAWYHATETLEDGSRRFDIVLFDAPATGHGLDMLRVPKVIVEVVPPGLLRREAERAWTMFQDPRQSGVLIVTQPEDMPTNETLELAGALRDELKLPLAMLVVNSVFEPLFNEAERTQLLAPRELDRNDPGDEAVACGIRRAIRERVQAASLAKLESIPAPRVELPLLLVDAATPAAVQTLSECF
ncbi:MAG TPA: ArsA family ATPase [Polyangiaceae bacterium]|nr:ArsA family ATPase [Polyangiaceae bacterium]